jgi:hypothetical protein
VPRLLLPLQLLALLIAALAVLGGASVGVETADCVCVRATVVDHTEHHRLASHADPARVEREAEGETAEPDTEPAGAPLAHLNVARVTFVVPDDVDAEHVVVAARLGGGLPPHEGRWQDRLQGVAHSVRGPPTA